MKQFIPLFFFINTIGSVFSQWNITNVGTGQDLYSVDYYSANDIWIGSYNQFIKTNNGGANWNLTAPLKDASNITIQPANIYDIAVTGPTSAIASGFYLMGNMEYVLSTTNGGANWNYAHSNNSGTLPRYMNSLDVWGTRAVAVGNTGRIVKSSTSGVSWSYVFPNPVTTLINDVKFGTFDTVYAAGSNKVLRSVDGGVNWTSQTITGSFETVSCDRGVVYIGNSISQMMLKSVDYGATYTTINLPFAYSGILYAVNKDNILAAGTDGVYVSFNGGIAWEKYDLPSYLPVKMFDFLNSSVGMAVGLGGYALKTTNLAAAPSFPLSMFTIQGNPTSVCYGDSISLINTSATLPGYTYEWKLNGVTFSNQYNAGLRFSSLSGTQTITLSVSNSFGSGTSSQSINVIGHDIPAVSYSASADSVCSGTKIGFTVTNSISGLSYQLRKGFANIGPVQNGNGGTLNFLYGTGLTNTTTFDLKVVKSTSCFTDSVIHTKTIYVIPSVGGPVAACIPAYNLCTHMGITNVTIGSINNTTNTMINNYFDYSCCQNAFIIHGNSIPISVTVLNANGENVKAWIDFDGNGSFNASTEQVLSGFANSTITATFSVPVGFSAFNQKLSLRVATESDMADLADPCFFSTFYCGQIEDYSITIVPAPIEPIASFTRGATVGCTTTISFSNTSYNATSYTWDFGDGSAIVTTRNAAHTYTVSGSYNVSMIACNNYGCDTMTIIQNINIPLVPIAPACSINISGGFVSHLNNFSFDTLTIPGSIGYKNYTCTKQIQVHAASVYNVSLNLAYTYTTSANFMIWIDYNNDGILSSAERINVAAGIYTTAWGSNQPFSVRIPETAIRNTPLRMRVIVYDGSYHGYMADGCNGGSIIRGGEANDMTIFISPPLPVTTNFAANSTALCTNTNVNFSNTSVNATSYLWDFGDGSTSTVAAPSHNYSTAGTYSVQLIASNTVYTDTMIRINYITVNTALPVPVIAMTGSALSTTAIASSYQWYRNSVAISGATSSSYNLTLDGTYKLNITNSNGCVTSSANYSHFPPHPNFTCSPTTICGSSTYTMFNNSSTNATSYVIYWGDGSTHTYNGSGAPIHTYYTPGIYTIKLKACNASGVCDSLIRTNYITINSPPSTPVITLTGTVLSTAVTATTYQWYRNATIISGATSSFYNATLDGTYKVVVANGACTATSANFSYFPVHVGFTATTTNGCSSNPINFTNSTTNGISYSWDFGDGTGSTTVSPSHSYVSAGTYTVKLRACNSLGCDSLTRTSYITINPSPYVTNSTSAFSCSGVLLTIPLTSTMSGSFFNWTPTMAGTSGATSGSGSDISEVITNTSVTPGTVDYLVTATAGGCVGPATTITVTVSQQPTMTSVSSGTICSGSSIIVPLSSDIPSTYSWIANDNPATTGESTTLQINGTLQDLIFNTSGLLQTLTYTITPNSGGCEGTSQNFTLNINPLIANSVSASGPLEFCQGDSVILTAIPSTSYAWSNGAITQSIIVSSNILASVTVIDSNGCESVSTGSQVIVNPIPVVSISPSGPLTLCIGDSITLDAGSGFASYLWSDGSTSSSVVVTSSGVDSVAVTDINGCTNVSSPVTITFNPLPVLVVTDPSPICAPGTVDISNSNVTSGSSAGVLSYWIDSLALSPLNVTYYTAVDTSASYFIRLENGGCSSIEAVNVSIDRQCIWPGDANNDSLVSNNDLLSIGLHYSQSGSPRLSVSNSWQAWPSENWGVLLTNGSDIKHADCNGDGLINDNDTLAVNLNFSSVHSITPQPVINRNNPYLYLSSNNSSYLPGDWIDIDVKAGSISEPVSDLYGLAFNINFDASSVQSGTESLTYPISWLGNPSVDAIKFARVDPLINTAFGAVTRIDHTNKDGNGKIATFRFQASSSISNISALNFSFSGYSANDSAGNSVLFNDSIFTIFIDPTATTITESSHSGSEINIYPNPYSDHTTIKYTLTEKVNVSLDVYNALGEIVNTIVNANQASGAYSYDFSAKELGMDAGIYFVKITINGKTTMKRIVEMK